MTKLLGKISAQMRSWSLSTYLFITVATTTAVCSGFVGYYALNTMYQNQLRDFWAIMHLELEVRIHEVEAGLRQQPWVSTLYRIRDLDKVPHPIVYRFADKQLLPYRGARDPVPLGELTGILTHRDLEISVVRVKGKPFVIRQLSGADLRHIFNESPPKGFYYGLWPFSLHQWLRIPEGVPEETLIYIANRRGQLLFSSDPSINDSNFAARDLSQRFIKSPLSAGQLEFQSKSGQAVYGFFREVTPTNMIVFAEVAKSDALRTARDLAYKTLLIGLGAVLAAVLLLHFPLNKMLTPIRELVALSRRISGGEFGLKPAAQAVGEVKALTDAFADMSTHLRERDTKIMGLMEEQREKVRLAAELRVASAIQNNLLPQEGIDSASRLNIAEAYIPASECAGDWYSHFFDPEHSEAVFCIADVSGHGTGSSIFTAAIASVFEQCKMRAQSFDYENFLLDAHRVIQRFGNQSWHASMLLGIYRQNKEKLVLVNAGHTPALHLSSDDDKGVFMTLPSSPLGFEGRLSIKREIIEFPMGSQLVLYTDGLTEAKIASGKPYGMKRLRKAASSNESAQRTLASIRQDFQKQAGSAQLEDDVCIMVVEAA